MAAVRYKSGAKLSGALYLNGKLFNDISKTSGSDYVNPGLHLEVTIPEGNLDFGCTLNPSNWNPTGGTATAEPWVWTTDENSSGAVIWGDGTIQKVPGAVTHTYPSAGVYQFVCLAGLINGVFVNNGNVTEVKNFGGQYALMYGGPYNLTNATCSSTTAPLLFQGPKFLTMGQADFDATNFMYGWRYNNNWMGHTGSSVFYGLTQFNNAGIGGVGVGVDTWEFPGQFETLATGTVTSLSTNGFIDANANFTSLVQTYPLQRFLAFKNLTTGATAYGPTAYGATIINDTTIGGLLATSNPSRSQVAQADRDIFTAVGQQYEIVNAWSTNSNFNGAFNSWSSFNQYIGSWNFKGLIDCFGGFAGWNSFNNGDAAGVAGGGVGVGMDNWDVSWCASLYGLMMSPVFNQYINSWNVGNNRSFQNFFSGASAFNRPLDNWNIGEHLGPNDPVRMDAMLRAATAFNQDIGAWDVSMVINMGLMFYQASSFNNDGVGGSGVGLDTWDTSNVTTMQDMFNRASVFDQDIGSWDVGLVTTAHSMFERASVFNSKPTSGNWGANLAAGEKVNLSDMFNRASVFDQDIGYFDTSRVSYMFGMFYETPLFNNGGVGGVGLGMDQWDVSSCYSFKAFLSNAPAFNQYIGSWTFLTGDISTGTNSSVVSNQLVDSSANFITDGVKSGIGMKVINNVTKKQAVVTLPALLYNGQRNNNPAPFKLIDTANVDYIAVGVVPGYIVNNIDAGTSAEVVSVDGAKELTLTADIFPINNQSYSIQPSQHLILSDDIFTASGTSYIVFQGVDMNTMFNNCTSYSQSMTNWNTENVADMYGMFMNCTSQIAGVTDFSQWDVARCTDLSQMFRNTPLNPDVTNWDTSSCTTLVGMFYQNFAFDKNISGWDTRNVEDISSMFRSASYDGDFSSWNIQSLENASLLTDGLSTANYDLLLDSTTGWASQATIQTGVSLGVGSTQYTLGGNAEAGRNVLTGTHGWTIVDGGGV